MKTAPDGYNNKSITPPCMSPAFILYPVSAFPALLQGEEKNKPKTSAAEC